MKQKIHIFRTRFKKDIVSEFIPPRKESNKVIIIASGMPGYPGRRDNLMKFLSCKGYWVFIPRYRGSWESDGKFLEKPPTDDVMDVIDELPKGFTDLWDGRKYKIEKPDIYVIGNSFGGPASFFASLDSRVKKIAALSPVVNWKIEMKRAPIRWIKDFAKEGFGNAYRFAEKEWDKLKEGKFYNPMTRVDELNGKKILIIHSEDDEVVPYEPVEEFAKRIKAIFIPLKHDGHLSVSRIVEGKFWRKIRRHFA